MIGLGVDAGGTETRWRLVTTTAVIATGQVAPLSGHVFDKKQEAAAEATIRQVCDDALSHAHPTAVVAGITGLSADTEAATFVEACFACHAGLARAQVQVMPDLHLLYVGAFPLERGVLVYAGSGAVACTRLEDGRWLRAGGYGYLVDDVAGGFGIAQAALRTVMRSYDRTGRASETPLARGVYAHYGSDDWHRLKRKLYEGDGRQNLARLAPVVATAAHAGDRAAASILRAAGRDLARLAQALCVRAADTQLEIAFSGGLTRLSPLLTDAFAEALGSKRLRVLTLEPVVTAAAMALKLSEAQAL